MIFGDIAVHQAEGCYLAHSLKVGDLRLKKGHLVSADDVARIAAAGIARLTAAKLDADDLHEEIAAARIAKSAADQTVRHDPPFTGRVNLFARHKGLLVADENRVNALNQLHPSITIATLPNFERVEENRMIATVKVIPFAAPRAAVEAAETIGELVRVEPFKLKNVALIATELPSLKPSTMDKTRKVLDERLKLMGAAVQLETRVAHDADAIKAAFGAVQAERPDLIIFFGASANVDERDVGPSGLIGAGGVLDHFGMPVDPGNLLFLGSLGDIPVIGAPGCARSPAENGFDWVLQRVIAGLPVTASIISQMGVGGLLMEINSRPQPRQGRETGDHTVTAVVLAAGRSTRMGEHNKLLAEIDGVPLVRCVVTALLASKVDRVLVVTGHMKDDVEEALAGLDVSLVHNPDFKDGLSTSLKCGIAALNQEASAALVALGDMPFIETAAFDKIIDAYHENDDKHAIVSTSHGKRGNPVLWSARFFEELQQVQGDTGARHLIGKYETVLGEVEIGEAAAIDLDTPDILHSYGGKLTT